MRDAKDRGDKPAEGTRVRPNETIAIGRAKVRNTTATSIQVQVDPDGVVTVTDCCLEEQDK